MEQITRIPKLKPRKADAHKGSFGKICIVAGSCGFSGAAALAGRASLRSGAGLVRVAVPEGILPIVASLEPCFTTIPLPEDTEGQISHKAFGILQKQTKENDVFAFGPGLGTNAGVRSVLMDMIAIQRLRMVVDADGLNCLAKDKRWISQRNSELILTPHPGEMKRMWQSIFRESMPDDRIETAARMARESGCIVLLKGANTVVSDGQRYFINTTGNPGMASAGSGDVLTGILTALMGQGLTSFDAAVLGAYVHGIAGDLAAETVGQIGLMATDIIESLSKAFVSYGEAQA